MTRKHYVMIADRIRRNGEAGMDALTLACLANDLAYEFAAENPRFDRERFIEACGVRPFAELVRVDPSKPARVVKV